MNLIFKDIKDYCRYNSPNNFRLHQRHDGSLVITEHKYDCNKPGERQYGEQVLRCYSATFSLERGKYKINSSSWGVVDWVDRNKFKISL